MLRLGLEVMEEVLLGGGLLVPVGDPLPPAGPGLRVAGEPEAEAEVVELGEGGREGVGVRERGLGVGASLG